MSSYRLSDNRSIFNRYIQQYIKEAAVDTTQFAPSNPDLAIQELENYIETLKKDTSVPPDVKDSQIKQAQAGIKQLQATTKPAAANPFDQMAADAGLGASAAKMTPQDLAKVNDAGASKQGTGTVTYTSPDGTKKTMSSDEWNKAPENPANASSTASKSAQPAVSPAPGDITSAVPAAGISAGASGSSEDAPEGDVTFKAASPVAVPVPGAAQGSSSEDKPEGDVKMKQAAANPVAPAPAPAPAPASASAPAAQQKVGNYTPEQLAAFKKANASDFDPNSSMDRAKMAKMTGGGTSQPQAAASQQVRRAIPVGNMVPNSRLPGVAGTASNLVGRAGDTLQNLFRGQLGKGQQRRPTSILPINVPKPGQIRR